MKPLLRRELFDGEESYFNENPEVAGMATEDGKVILNPYSTNNEDQRNAVYLNEASRLHMKSSGTPEFELTQKQNEFLDSNTYKNASAEDRRQTILARILSGDSSAQDFTDEQAQHADSVKRAMDAAEYKKAWREQ